MIPTVLLIEEQPVLRAKYEHSLRDHGYAVVTAGSTQGLLDLARRVLPDIVVLDPDACGGSGMRAALDLQDAGLDAALVFNTSRPYNMETDFSTWIADSYAIRALGVGDLTRALQRVATKVVAPAG